MPVLVILAAAAVASSLPLLWWALAAGRGGSRASSNGLLQAAGTTDLREVMLRRSASERAVRPLVGRLAERSRRLTPTGAITSLEHRIALAGRPADWPLERVLAMKLLLALVGGAYGLLRFSKAPSAKELVITIAATALGYWLPDIVLRRQGINRQLSIREALPDTLDQMTICVEAGLGFEAAMARAGRGSDTPLSQELIRTLQEMQIGVSRGAALRNLAARTDVPELRRFVLALTQAEQYGLAIADVLRVQAGDLRVKRRQRAEERAMKIPVKVLFPLITCILPTLFIVILGPAGIQFSQGFNF